MKRLIQFLDTETNEVLSRLREYGEAWVVGGWLRDMIIEGNPKGDEMDIDIATTLMPGRVKEIFPKSISIGENFGTIGVRLESSTNRIWEVTTLRAEQDYSDGRRPDDVDFGVTIIEDLARRDFTINAMALDKIGEIIDPYDGQKDIMDSIIRAVGNPSERIQEDGLRILRAFRFMSTGKGEIRKLDVSLGNSIIEHLDSLENISKERIGSEFLKILSGNYINEIITSMKEHGIFDTILPEINIKNSYNFTNNRIVNLALICSDTNIDGMGLSHYLMDKLRISKDDARTISILHNCRDIELDSSIESVRRFLVFHDKGTGMMIIEYLKSLNMDLEQFISGISSIDSPDIIKPLADGNLLSEITGLEPSKRLGKLKDWLFRKQIEGDIKEIDGLLQVLNEIDWKDSDPEYWEGMEWP